MALIKCPECDKEISDKVKRCPQCGYPIRKTSKLIKIVIAVIFFIIFALIITFTLTKLNKQNGKSQEVANKDLNIETTQAIDTNEENYLEAQNAFESTNYVKAKELFELNPDYKDSNVYLDKIEYNTTYKGCVDDVINCIKYLYNNLKNPESLQIHQIYCYGYTPGVRQDFTYIDYSAQNGFGGMNREVAYFSNSEYLDITMAAYSTALYNYDENKNDLENDIQVYDRGKYTEIVGEIDLDMIKELLPENLKFCVSN